MIEVLSKLVSVRGAQRYLRSDDRPAFVSNRTLEWIEESKIGSALIDPGEPSQNGANESFNGRFRDECLNVEWFRSLREARVVIETWRRHNNEVRPHSRLRSTTMPSPATRGLLSRNRWSEIARSGQ